MITGSWNPWDNHTNRIEPKQKRREKLMEDEDRDAEAGTPGNQNKKKSVITIPSYQEVIKSSEIKSTPPQNLFTPSKSFSQAFAFVKSSEFYEAPPKSAAPQNPSPRLALLAKIRFLIQCFLWKSTLEL